MVMACDLSFALMEEQKLKYRDGNAGGTNGFDESIDIRKTKIRWEDRDLSFQFSGG